jgi:hypothetical protein
MLGRTQSVNPFLTVMYLKISFREWLSYTRKEEALKMKNDNDDDGA